MRTSATVSNDFASLSQTFERTCKLPTENSNRTELRTLDDTSLSSCSDWKTPSNGSIPNSCIFLNENNKLDKKCQLRVRNCTQKDNTQQAFCQYHDDFGDCHCSQWSLVSTSVSANFTHVLHNLERTCQYPYDNTNNTKLTTVNQTLSNCSEWEQHYDQVQSCVFINTLDTSTPCSKIQSKRCKSDSAEGVQYLCQHVSSPCTMCSGWLKTAQSRSSDFKTLTTQYERLSLIHI